MASDGLDRDAILAEGAARAGVNGVDRSASWVDALGQLVGSANHEGGLSPAGAAAMTEKLTDLTSERLRAEALLRVHPEVARRPISVRFAVTGFARSGTTVLQRLLGTDPDVEFLATWQAFRPVPSGVCAPVDDPRRNEMVQTVETMKSMGALALHPMATDEPEEEVFLLQHSFASLLFELNCPMPSYVEWLGATDQGDAYRFVLDLLRLNEWAASRPAGRPRIAKSPQYLFDLMTVLDVMPDAVIVRMHRDPVELVGSYCSVYANSRRRFVAELDLHELGTERVRELERIAERARDARASADPARFVDVEYDHLMKDPLGAVEEIYAAAALPLADVARHAAQSWLDANPKGAGGSHDYDLADYGLDPDDIRARFAT